MTSTAIATSRRATNNRLKTVVGGRGCLLSQCTNTLQTVRLFSGIANIRLSSQSKQVLILSCAQIGRGYGERATHALAFMHSDINIMHLDLVSCDGYLAKKLNYCLSTFVCKCVILYVAIPFGSLPNQT